MVLSLLNTGQAVTVVLCWIDGQTWIRIRDMNDVAAWPYTDYMFA